MVAELLTATTSGWVSSLWTGIVYATDAVGAALVAGVTYVGSAIHQAVVASGIRPM